MQFHTEVINLKKTIAPHKTNLKKIRIGGNDDGGYVINEIPGVKYDALYSYGSNDCIIFEKAFYEKYGADSYTYDHTIPGLTEHPPYIHFFKEGVAGGYNPMGPCNSIDNHISKNNHKDSKNLFMQIDVEGHEWESLYMCDRLDQFAQLIIECHFSRNPFCSTPIIPIPSMQAVFEKLNKNFVCTHVHGNNNEPCPWLDLNLPKVIEVSYVRKDLVEDYGVDMGTYPTELDFPNRSDFPDLPIDWWKHTYRQ